MRARFYWSYATRSLRRGGQRTVLAIFCIAVGVMAIVALQLAGLMVSNNLTSNVRASNGGDISVRQDITPFAKSDLSFFDDLRRRGLASGVTAVTDDRAIAYHAAKSYPVTIGAVDPSQYPLAGQPQFDRPAHGDIHGILAPPDAAIVAEVVATYLHVGIGDTVNLNGGAGRTLTAHVEGILRNGTATGGVDVLVQRESYARSSGQPLTYNVIYLTTSGDIQTGKVASLIRAHFPLATVQTVSDALNARRDQTQLLHQLLEVIGILALLLGGFGVVNTMNVMLARRRIEIAMLKTTGYRRRDLYALFGLEAALLGAGGGVAGALIGTGLSLGVKTLIENAFQLQLQFVFDLPTVVMGVAVGLCTAVIFGLLPIVRAAYVRPQAVLRDLPERTGWGSRLGTVGLIAILSILFCALASGILGSVVWGIGVVYGIFIVLGLLSLFFGAVIWLVGALPVPERVTVRQVVLSTLGLAAGIAATKLLASVGGLIIAAAVLGYAIPFLPRPWKATIKLSLRDISRQRTRSTMTLLALFVGVFTVGLMVVLGQDVRTKFADALSTLLDYNVVSLVPATYAAQYDAELRHLGGLEKSQAVNAVQTVPMLVNNRPIVDLLRNRGVLVRAGPGNLGAEGTLAYLSGLTGLDLRRQATGASIPKGDGRNLGAEDVGSTNVLLPTFLHILAPLKLKLGDHVTVADQFRARTITLKVVGFYTPSLFINTQLPILASRALVHSFGGIEEQYIYSLKIDPRKTDAAVAQLNRHVAHAATLNLTSLGAIVDQVLGNLVVLLVALASLALFAGIIIIANTVALAMLERRREQGILKSVGYTSSRVLGGVLVENGIVGGLGSVLGIVLVAATTYVLSRNVFKTDLAVPPLTTLGMIVLVTAIALATAWLVSWSAVRFRPAEVLRYE